MSESAFVQVIDWARYYARVGLSVIPTAKGQKSPGVAWERFQERCPTGSEIDSWFTNFYRECGCGMVTGQVSRNIFVIDADAGPGKQGVENLDELQMLHDDLPDTWQAKSGGGGRHYFLQAPPHLRIKTGKNVLGLHVDVRGEGGFIVLAPSMHPSGNRYEWIPGMDPSSNTPIAMAPDWLLNLVVDTAPQPAVRPDRPLGAALDEKDYLSEFNAFGMRVDGREQYMRDLIWARLLEERRDSPIPPAGSVLETILAELWEVYERKVKARGGSLEADRRGIGEMRRKLGYALKKWDTRIATDAGKPKPGGDRDGMNPKQAPGPAPSSRFPFEKVDDLRKLPPIKWLVRDWIPDGTTGLFYGKWATGKSFIGFDLSLHLAYGMSDWHGAELPQDGADVLVIAREGHQGFVQRIDAFRKQYELDRDTDRIVFMRASVSFMRDDEFSGLCNAIKGLPNRFRMVMVDTVARVIPGIEMSKPEAITLFMERCSRLSELTSATVLGIHHQNKLGTMMGSIFFEANSDFVYEITRVGEEDEPLTKGEILCTKMKDGEDRWKRTVSFKKISLATSFDARLSSLVVDFIVDPKSAPQDPLPDANICDMIMKAIDKAWQEGNPVSQREETKKARRYAPAIYARAFDVPAWKIVNLLNARLENGTLVDDVFDRKQKKRGLRVANSTAPSGGSKAEAPEAFG